VVVAGRLLFSKKQTGRFPKVAEVEGLVSQLKAGREFPEAAAVDANRGFAARILAKLLGWR
jgi:hypothetical protein